MALSRRVLQAEAAPLPFWTWLLRAPEFCLSDTEIKRNILVSKPIVTGSLVVFADGDDGVHVRGRRDIWGWRGAMVGWSSWAWSPVGVKIAWRVPVSCTAQQVGTPPPVVRVRVLCCGKAGRFLLAPRDTKSGSSRPSPSRSPRSAAPRKDRTSPFSPHCGFAELSKPGWTPFSPRGSGVYPRLSLLVDQCLTENSAKYRQCHSTL